MLLLSRHCSYNTCQQLLGYLDWDLNNTVDSSEFFCTSIRKYGKQKYSRAYYSFGNKFTQLGLLA
jgi:hypothetical protein